MKMFAIAAATGLLLAPAGATFVNTRTARGALREYPRIMGLTFMRTQTWFGITLAALVIALGSGAVLAQPAPRQGACRQIRAACEQAGFTQGGVQQGMGLWVDCIRPTMQGTPQRRRAGAPLPQVDPQLVAACSAQNPNFGRGNAGQKGEQPESAAPPPPATMPASPPAPRSETRPPNFVFVLTDDLSWNLVQYMPHVLKMQKDGVTFTNYFVTDSLCCPSRSSIFTGRYPHNTGIFRNVGADGGYLAFHSRGYESATFATALSAAGYRTAMLGKYLNGYQPAAHAPASGWALWAVAGNGYPGFNYALNRDGTVARFGAKPEDYMTDVLSGIAVDFIKQSANKPFLIEVATFAPHAPYVPAPRDQDGFPGLLAPRAAAYDAAPDPGAPRWLRSHRALSAADMMNIDRDFRKRAQSVLAVDKMIGELQAAVESIDATGNTYFIFSSDNGYHMGEHRLMPGKMTAFDMDIHVPLVVTGPGVPVGASRDQVVENIDLCPTFTDLAGMTTAATIDGRSLVPLLRDRAPGDWRIIALIEHRGPVRERLDPDLPGLRSGNPPSYEAIRSLKSLYVEYADGNREFHDLGSDPDELRNTYAALSAEQKEVLRATLAAVQSCQGEQACRAAESSFKMTQR
jgi:N-acetylglucosamine-6-sulfatase